MRKTETNWSHANMRLHIGFGCIVVPLVWHSFTSKDKEIWKLKLLKSNLKINDRNNLNGKMAFSGFFILKEGRTFITRTHYMSFRMQASLAILFCTFLVIASLKCGLHGTLFQLRSRLQVKILSHCIAISGKFMALLVLFSTDLTLDHNNSAFIVDSDASRML